MFKDNLATLRRLHHMTQEELAEKVGVTRQALSRWESGDSVPDLERSRILAEIFDVSLDELATHDSTIVGGLPIPPRGKHLFGVVTVEEGGQIVIPARARALFSISQGDRLIVLGDEQQGLALLKENDFLAMADQIRRGGES